MVCTKNYLNILEWLSLINLSAVSYLQLIVGKLSAQQVVSIISVSVAFVTIFSVSLACIAFQ